MVMVTVTGSVKRGNSETGFGLEGVNAPFLVRITVHTRVVVVVSAMKKLSDEALCSPLAAAPRRASAPIFTLKQFKRSNSANFLSLLRRRVSQTSRINFSKGRGNFKVCRAFPSTHSPLPPPLTSIYPTCPGAESQPVRLL